MEKKFPNLIKEMNEQWPGQRPIKIMFQDEARFGLISDIRRCWCPRPIRPLCSAIVSQEYSYAYAAVSIEDGETNSLILPYVNTDCMQIFIDDVALRHPEDRILMVMDNAGWHKTKSLKIPCNIKFAYLPSYSPELNPVEHIWDDLREKSFHNRIFDCFDSFENHLEKSLLDLENNKERVHSIVSWPWIINALMF